METIDRSRPTVLAVLALVTLAAFALRFTALSNGLPQLDDPDTIIVKQATYLERVVDERGEMLVLPKAYPHLLAWMLHAIPGTYTPQPPEGASLAEHLRAASYPDLTARRLIALLSIFFVPGTFLLARRFFAPGWSLFAAATMAVSFFVVYFARVAKPHGALGTFCLFTVLGAMAIARTGSKRAFFATGIFAALALGTLHSASAVFPAILAAYVLHLLRSRKLQWRLLVPPVFIALSVVLLYPFLFEGQLWASREFRADKWDGTGFRTLAQAVAGMDPVLTVLATIGLVIGLPWLRRREVRNGVRGELLVLAAYAVPYTLVIGAFYTSWPRFLMLVMPCVACLATLATERTTRLVARALSDGALRRAVPIAVAVLVLSLSTFASARYVFVVCRRPHSTDVAAAWIADHVDRKRDVVLLSPLLHLPLLQDMQGLRALPSYAWAPIQRYQWDIRDRRIENLTYHLRALFPHRTAHEPVPTLDETFVQGFVDRFGGDWAVVAIPDEPDRRRADFIPDAIRGMGGELMTTVSSYSRHAPPFDLGGAEGLLTYEGMRMALLAERLGPEIEIYRLPGAEPRRR